MPTKSIFEEIKHGVNIDLYVTLLLAFILAVANFIISVFEISIDYDITPINISVLFFVTITLIANRRKLDSALNLLDQNKKAQDSIAGMLQEDHSNDIEENFPESYQSDICDATEIVQIGIHLSTNLNENYDAYRKMLENGGKLKILIVKPDGHAFEMAAMRFPGGVGAEQEESRIRFSLKTLEKLQEEFNTIEIKLIDYLFGYSALMVNPRSIDSAMYIERYTFRIQGGSKKPKKVLNRNDGKWFEIYKHEITELWKLGINYDSSSSGE